MLVRIASSLVRLKTFDLSQSCIAHAAMNRKLPWPPFQDGKDSPLRWRILRRDHQLISQMIEGRAQLMNDISDPHCEIKRWKLLDSKSKHGRVTVWLDLAYNIEGIGLQILPNSFVQAHHVL
jgi:hypothetical protein